jgi:hypothetical protein
MNYNKNYSINTLDRKHIAPVINKKPIIELDTDNVKNLKVIAEAPFKGAYRDGPAPRKYICCNDEPMIETPLDMTKSKTAPISGYGFSQYSAMSKTNIVSEKHIDKINKEIQENNINFDDIFERKLREKKIRKANLGNDVISYRLKSSKEI